MAMLAIGNGDCHSIHRCPMQQRMQASHAGARKAHNSRDFTVVTLQQKRAIGTDFIMQLTVGNAVPYDCNKFE